MSASGGVGADKGFQVILTKLLKFSPKKLKCPKQHSRTSLPSVSPGMASPPKASPDKSLL